MIAAELRQTAFAVAYRMLGNAADAEDIAQNCAVKLLSVDFDKVQNPHGYVAKMSSREALNALRKRQVRTRHASKYALPLPNLSEQDARDARLDLSYGIVVLTQKLPPLSRAVFILRNAFDLSYEEIADAFERSPAACRQAYDRGKRKMEASGAPNNPISIGVIQELSTLILAGDIAGITARLADDVVFHSDGGGVAPDLGRPVSGADRIARFLAVSPHLLAEGTSFRVADTPQGAMLVAENAEELLLLVIGEVSENGISALYAISDPAKLAELRGLI